MFVNYAHRGASEYAPENTFSSFYLGLLQGANGIETDVRLTKDNVPVLFHDETVDRVTDGVGFLSDFTLKELSEINVHKENCAIADKIPTLEDFLRHFAHRDVTFAIEIKQAGMTEKVIEFLKKYEMIEKTVVTSFEYEYLENIYNITKEIKLGYLVDEATETELERLKIINGYQICPNAEKLDLEKVEKLRKMGFSIRVWNVRNEAIMKEICNYSIDGMTVNFPDKLAVFMKVR